MLEQTTSDTLLTTHICDGEEVVNGGEDGQLWVATFGSLTMAEVFILSMKRTNAPIWGIRDRSAQTAAHTDPGVTK